MFDRDIWGQPWQPCAACPHANPSACPSRRHRALCGSVDALRDFIAGQAEEHRTPVDRGVVSTPPVEFVGPPQLVVDLPTSPDATPPPALVRNSLLECRELINSCDYRGPVIVGGCSCTRLCWLGKGYNPQNLPYGQVKDLDCLTCVRSNE